MAKSLELQITHNGGTFTFSVEGEYLPRWEPVYRFNANPPEVVEMRQTWEFRQCKLVASSVSALWTGSGATIATLNTLLSTRGTGHPTSAALVADPSGSATTLVTLGPSDYEQFTIEALEGETDGATPRASWRLSAAFTLRISAVKKNADSTTGMVGFDQAVSYTYEDGLTVVEMRTTITTKEGTSAVAKAQTYGYLDVNNFGSDYSYETNGPDGIDYEYDDADEVNSRTPTRCTAVSRLRQWGVNVGTTAPGGAPSRVGYTVTTRRTSKETITRYTISASGPNYLAWVRSRKPTGSLSLDEIVDDQATRTATGTYERKTSRNGGEGNTLIKVDWSGGYADPDFEPAAGGYEPVVFVGGSAPWQAVVAITVEAVGGSGTIQELKLPGLPGEPFHLIRSESTEGEPYEDTDDDATDDAQTKWKREARLVFRSATAPTGPLADKIRNAPTVDSYYIPVG